MTWQNSNDIVPSELCTSRNFRDCTMIFAKGTGTQFKHDKREMLAIHPRTIWQIWPCNITPTTRIKMSLKNTLLKLLETTSCRGQCVKSLRPSDAYMRQQNIPTLLQIMACRLFGAKPLSIWTNAAILSIIYHKEHISVKFHLKFKSFHLKKCT